MPDVPIRLTRGRTEALLRLFERGLVDDILELQSVYRVRITDSLEVEPAHGALEFLWTDAETESALRMEVQRLRDARAAAEIIRRRYLTQ